MTRTLNARERKALDKLSFDHRNFHIRGELVGIGPTTLKSLVDLGLLEVGPSKRHYDQLGWRITPNGWRCMYGKTYEEIMSEPGPHHPLRVWEWPPQ